MTPRQAQTAILALCIIVAVVVALGWQGTVWLLLTVGTAYFFADTSRWRKHGRWQPVAFGVVAIILLAWLIAAVVFIGR